MSFLPTSTLPINGLLDPAGNGQSSDWKSLVSRFSSSPGRTPLTHPAFAETAGAPPTSENAIAQLDGDQAAQSAPDVIPQGGDPLELLGLAGTSNWIFVKNYGTVKDAKRVAAEKTINELLDFAKQWYDRQPGVEAIKFAKEIRQALARGAAGEAEFTFNGNNGAKVFIAAKKHAKAIYNHDFKDFSNVHDLMRFRVSAGIRKKLGSNYNKVMNSAINYLNLPTSRLREDLTRASTNFMQEACDVVAAMHPNENHASIIINRASTRLRLHEHYIKAIQSLDDDLTKYMNDPSSAAGRAAKNKINGHIKILWNAGGYTQAQINSFGTLWLRIETWIESGALRGAVTGLRLAGLFEKLIAAGHTSATAVAEEAAASFRTGLWNILKAGGKLDSVARASSGLLGILIIPLVCASAASVIFNGKVASSQGVGRLLGDLAYIGGLSFLGQKSWEKIGGTKLSASVVSHLKRIWQPLVQVRNITEAEAVTQASTSAALGIADVLTDSAPTAAELTTVAEVATAEGSIFTRVWKAGIRGFLEGTAERMTKLFAAGDILIGIGNLIAGVTDLTSHHKLRGAANVLAGVFSITAGALMLAGLLVASPYVGFAVVAATALSFGFGLWAAALAF